uniref:RNA binding protein, putative n=1 Tax=Leishmania guyanensis TaxID=5670 RepID=A0A1E1J377_LEIGU|nr:RNA binding protein, putative [Leishmania guyanensis]
MVSFTCNYCQDVVKKPKVQSHANACGCDTFTCVDCMRVFDLHTIKGHTSCVTEEEKYQGKWKQKLSNGSRIVRSAVALRGNIERPPCALMNDLSSSDENSDDDWVTRRGGKGAGAPQKSAVPTSNGHPKPSATVYRKHPRPGVSLSSSDDDDTVKKCATTVPMAPAHKKAKAACSASVTPSSRWLAAAPVPPVQSPAMGRPEVKKGTAAHAAPVPHQMPKEVRDEAEWEVAHPGKEDTPLLLPRSTMPRDCIVPSFVLGTSEEVAGIVADVLNDSGVSSMRTKEVAKGLVERYAKRIAKSVRHAVEMAAESGALRMDSDGSVSVT